ncbi:hypothetical protein [Nonomuraea endophytica]|uniref:Uncharacterized protein n=1 Tax=Nonomuraea endophytica TaxID=714136 RepID=A0A7W7ZYW8_9ACTN|nr:hypothetical protein [Nonomuraea endophytica]MBB5076387.1 hypothetical protein [Nonomuraea endophytica]
MSLASLGLSAVQKRLYCHFYLNPARGGGTSRPNRFAFMAWPDWLTYDSIAPAPSVSRPTLIVHSQDAAIPDGARRFHDGADMTGRMPERYIEAIFSFYGDGTLDESRIYPTVEDVTGTPPRSFRQWALAHRAAFSGE